MSAPDPPPAGPARRLPRRPPRPLAIHFLVDAAVTFCVIVLPCLFVGLPLVPTAIGAVLIGALLSPWSRRREIAALARRPPAGAIDAESHPAEPEGDATP